jgi:hypothetical protein
MKSFIRRAFINAFSKWSAVSQLSFREVRGDADILIDFKRRDHKDGSPFDGRSRSRLSLEMIKQNF